MPTIILAQVGLENVDELDCQFEMLESGYPLIIFGECICEVEDKVIEGGDHWRIDILPLEAFRSHLMEYALNSKHFTSQYSLYRLLSDFLIYYYNLKANHVAFYDRNSTGKFQQPFNPPQPSPNTHHTFQKSQTQDGKAMSDIEYMGMGFVLFLNININYAEKRVENKEVVRVIR